MQMLNASPYEDHGDYNYQDTISYDDGDDDGGDDYDDESRSSFSPGVYYDDERPRSTPTRTPSDDEYDSEENLHQDTDLDSAPSSDEDDSIHDGMSHGASAYPNSGGTLILRSDRHGSEAWSETQWSTEEMTTNRVEVHSARHEEYRTGKESIVLPQFSPIRGVSTPPSQFTWL